ncbi:2OG-Fe(II) oxygenase [Paremcibacter congregatus]|uniref:Oxidoreductase n=1 Tax=Paremcibacter congregatus TaxID=2043170 RepID=A0A2G4YLV4_9PROT|nr:2OG-Fe(II) oxygenase [Paremcibacter congregatus]PHZ83281.1 oxidoreductase [Paremcibacter congregatus]QDE28245.1 2OG-Fe(II) oxygenase [Paremcibacter congregatus]
MRPSHRGNGPHRPEPDAGLDYRGLLGHNAPPLVYAAATYPDALSPEECQQIIAHIDSQDLRRGRLAGGLKAPLIRSVASEWLDEHQIPWLTERIVKYVARANSSNFPFDLLGFDEGFQVLKYSGDALSGPDFYDWHIDMGHSGASQSRKLSVLIQLSKPDTYQGGALEVNFDGTAIPLGTAQGTLCVIPSFTLHRVCPVTAGRRYSLATWVHGPTFK